jgi:uncharacterized protein YqeY
VSERGDSVERAGPNGSPETLKERLAREITASMKAREAVRLGALRMLAAAVKNEEVRPEVLHPLSDDEFRQVVGREVKRRREAADAFDRAGRVERADREREEERVLEAYLPAALSEAELEALIDQAVASTGATGSSDFGAVMRTVMAGAKGRADGKVVQERVRARLGR